MKASDKDLNRKAFPKFLLLVGGGALVGFCAGLASGVLRGLNAGEWASVRLPALLGTIAPWGIPVSSVILLASVWRSTAPRKRSATDGTGRTRPPLRRRTGG